MIIAFSGRAGCGKSTAAKMLVEGFGYHRISFADPIRDMLECLGISREMSTRDKNVPIPWLSGHTPRSILQKLGTDFGRNMISENIWVDIAERKIKSHLDKHIVFDDLRFDSEAEMIRRLSGKVILIHRDGLPVMDHESERGIKWGLIDAVVENKGSPDEFSNEVLDTVDKLFKSTLFQS